MQPRALLFIALLAPQSAAAFGDLDCISIESCNDNSCIPASDLFSVSFDWAEGVAIVTVDDVANTLPLTSPITRKANGADGLQTVVEYGELQSDLNLLRIEAVGDNILAYWTVRGTSTQTWVAQCDKRQAA